MRKRWLITLIALVICGALGGQVALAQKAATKKTSAKAAKKAALKQKLNAMQAQIAKVKSNIRQKEKQKKTVVDQLSDTQQQLEVKQSSVASNSLRLLDAQADLTQTIKRLDRTIKQMKRRQSLLSDRVADIYEGEDVGYANVVLGSVDMWTFLTRAYYLKCILDTDTRLLREIKQDKRNIEADKARQTRTVGHIKGLQTVLVAERNEVSSLAAEQRGQIMAIEDDKDLMEKTLNALLAKSREIESRIQAYQSTAQGKQMLSQTFRGGLSRPCGGSISSSFGYRRHPITGVYKLHTGVDIRAPRGTAIHAAANGVVISAGWEGAYGNAVIIDHGGGVSTLYGHCSRLYVRSGQRVSRGETIAAVGSTGYSTGPHCHFEKRVNGTPVRPM